MWCWVSTKSAAQPWTMVVSMSFGNFINSAVQRNDGFVATEARTADCFLSYCDHFPPPAKGTDPGDATQSSKYRRKYALVMPFSEDLRFAGREAFWIFEYQVKARDATARPAMNFSVPFRERLMCVVWCVVWCVVRRLSSLCSACYTKIME